MRIGKNQFLIIFCIKLDTQDTQYTALLITILFSTTTNI